MESVRPLPINYTYGCAIITRTGTSANEHCRHLIIKQTVKRVEVLPLMNVPVFLF